MGCAQVELAAVPGRFGRVAMAALGHDMGPRPTPRPSRVSERAPRTQMTDPNPESHPVLLRIARGDADAVGACLERYGALVWSVVSKAWKDVATIEDLVQEIFIDVWKSAARFDPARASEATFIATIARRRVIDRRRRQGRAPEHALIDEVEVAGEDVGLAQVDLGDDARLARQALAELRPVQRRVILMSVVDGLTHLEIATATGLPLGTVKSHIRRGLDQAAQTLRSARREDE